MSNNIERIWFFGYLKYLCFLFSSFMILPQYLSNDSGVRLCTSSGLYCRFWAVACCYCFRWGEFEPAKHRKFESFNSTKTTNPKPIILHSCSVQHRQRKLHNGIFAGIHPFIEGEYLTRRWKKLAFAYTNLGTHVLQRKHGWQWTVLKRGGNLSGHRHRVFQCFWNVHAQLFFKALPRGSWKGATFLEPFLDAGRIHMSNGQTFHSGTSMSIAHGETRRRDIDTAPFLPPSLAGILGFFLQRGQLAVNYTSQTHD